ncbi:photosynthetic complex assembly protein PuhC [Thioflavicoccus mobilis]|uniref:photosynthetic complex assembly protein PuhC n=1 Tax=Thioflavicoccus mobilis TaxID=80679 RepID=UPI0012FBD778|nr:photosynthetic complex assembly protein PuhC [Thioflavicoccus mobilis]
MSEQEKQEKKVRKGPPIGFFVILAGLVGLAVFIASTSERITPEDRAAADQLSVPVVASLDVSFVVQDDGSVAVYDVATDEQIDTLLPGHDKFLQQLLEKYRRDRKKAGVEFEEPYRLIQVADGRVIFKDLVTGNKLDNVWAFGTDNVKPFLRLLQGAERP